MPHIELNVAGGVGGGGSAKQSLYTQLSQNNVSDSDSEDEVIRFQSRPRANHLPGTINSATTAAPKLDNHPILMTPRTEEMYLNYAAGQATIAAVVGGPGPKSRPCNILLDLDGSTSDTVAILNDGGVNSTNNQDDELSTGHIIAGIRKPMGPCRKVCFYSSIFVCFASVVIFLWALPCDNELTCSARNRHNLGEDQESHNWIREFEKVEFKSVISVTEGLPGYGKNLLFMYRSDKVFEDPQPVHRHRNGIIALMGSRGKIAWYDQMVDEPSSMDCGLLDVDKNGRPDCLVIDEYGQLGCINPVSGQWMWHISLYQDADNITDKTKSVRRKAIDLLDFPVILPDIDEDSVNDLLLVTSLEQINHNNFLFVSGANGRPIGKAYSLQECQFIHKLILEIGFNLAFNCINNETELMKVMTLAELYGLATDGKELPLGGLKSPEDILQHKFYGQRRNTHTQRNIYSNGVANLIVENSGKCPLNCTMSMAVSSTEGDKISIIQGSGMYGMVPAVLRTKKKKGSKEPIIGFVIKFWEWNEEGSSERDQEGPAVADGARVKRAANETEHGGINWKFVKKESWTAVPGERNKREATVNPEEKESNPMKDLVKRTLKEHVVLIMFNGTTHKVINTSQSDVIQFCRERTANGMNSFCQPDMNYQENSVNIADLDQDGYQELISFYSTFVWVPETETWKLVTYVQQFRLETELMSLSDT